MNWTVTATEARRDFFKLLSKTQNPGASVTITIEGLPKAVILSIEDFEGWQETLEIMSDKNLMDGIQMSLQEISQGKKLHSEEEVRKQFNL